MRYLLLTAVGGYFFYRLSFWDFVGGVFAAMFLLVGLVGLAWRNPNRLVSDGADEDGGEGA